MINSRFIRHLSSLTSKTKWVYYYYRRNNSLLFLFYFFIFFIFLLVEVLGGNSLKTNFSNEPIFVLKTYLGSGILRKDGQQNEKKINLW